MPLFGQHHQPVPGRPAAGTGPPEPGLPAFAAARGWAPAGDRPFDGHLEDAAAEINRTLHGAARSRGTVRRQGLQIGATSLLTAPPVLPGGRGQPAIVRVSRRMLSSSFTTSSLSTRSAAAMFSRRWPRDEVPGISAMAGERCSSQASAVCWGWRRSARRPGPGRRTARG